MQLYMPVIVHVLFPAVKTNTHTHTPSHHSCFSFFSNKTGIVDKNKKKLKMVPSLDLIHILHFKLKIGEANKQFPL